MVLQAQTNSGQDAFGNSVGTPDQRSDNWAHHLNPEPANRVPIFRYSPHVRKSNGLKKSGQVS